MVNGSTHICVFPFLGFTQNIHFSLCTQNLRIWVSSSLQRVSVRIKFVSLRVSIVNRTLLITVWMFAKNYNVTSIINFLILLIWYLFVWKFIVIREFLPRLVTCTYIQVNSYSFMLMLIPFLKLIYTSQYYY